MEVVIDSYTYGTQIVLIDEEDFYLLKDYRWVIWGSKRHNSLYVIGGNYKNNPYKEKRLHRIIMNAPDDMVVDHINGNGLDNRKINLRITTQAKNNRNSSKRKKGSSKYKGVDFDKQRRKWRGQIQVNMKKTMAYFDTEEEAAIWYNTKALELHGEFAKLNEIDVLMIAKPIIAINLAEAK